MPGNPRVVAAIDFGTYASGYAWLVVDPRVREPADYQIVHNNAWPGNEDVSAAKTRTALLVDGPGKIAAYGSEAYHVIRDRRAKGAPLGVLVDDFKVAMKTGVSGYKISRNDRALTGLKRAGLSVDQAAASYLKWMYSQALADMARSGIQTGDIEWCLTVPAIWEPAEKDRMRTAATAAGIRDDHLHLALEPEAAAIYAYLTQGQLSGGQGAGALDLVRVGSRFMVVDGGGGTVDITAYRVVDEGGKTGLGEIGRAKGERLGSEYLNLGFIDLISRHLGGSAAAYEMEKADPVGFGDLMQKWANEKRYVQFEPKESVEVALGARIDRWLSPAMRKSLAQSQAGVDDSIVALPREISDIFAAVVEPTLDYIDRQLSEMAAFTSKQLPMETILLAGGFAASPYLQEAIRRRFVGRASVIQAMHPETAVLHGAVHFARDPEITRIRRVQHTWGLSQIEDFDASRHDSKHRKRVSGRDACDGIFGIYVHAGDPISPDKPATQTTLPYDASQDNILLELYSTLERWPDYVDDPGCAKSASVTIPISNMKHLPRDQREVEVAMYFGRAELEVHATNTLSRETRKLKVKYSQTLGD